MKWISWNVNGLRACLNKGFLEFIRTEQPDVMALQEIKMRQDQADFSIDDYHMIWNSAEKSGYSGTAVLVKKEPLRVLTGIGYPELDAEGRCITLVYPNITFEIWEAEGARILELLDSHLIEVAITRTQVDNLAYQLLVLPNEPLVIVMNKNNSCGKSKDTISGRSGI